MQTEKTAGAAYEKGDIESFVYPGRYPTRDEGDTLTDLYGRADKAMYLAKVSGRNRIEINVSQRNRSSATM